MKILEDERLRELLLRLNKGDEGAFNTLYKAYGRPMYLRMLYLLKDTNTADELLQELFVKLWVNRAGVDSNKSFQSYLYTIAQNLVYNHFRKVANERSMVKFLVKDAVEHPFNKEYLAENQQVSQLLQQAVEQLSPQRKQVFTLCKLEGKSYEEAARIMGISTATVNSHMTKSLQFIREYMIRHQDVLLLLLGAYTQSVIFA